MAEGHWDVVLSDYAMPHFDGLRALRALREQSAFLPFIIISGSIGEETAVAAMRAGASDYLMKDNLTRLVPAIERELREAAGRRERARTKKALLEMQEKFQAVFREYLDVMLVLDAADGAILHVNHAVAQTMGYDERALAGQGFETFWPDRPAADGSRGARSGARRRVGVSLGLVFAARRLGAARWICRPAGCPGDARRRSS